MLVPYRFAYIALAFVVAPFAAAQTTPTPYKEPAVSPEVAQRIQHVENGLVGLNAGSS